LKALLEAAFASEKEEWRLLAAKASKWLKTQTKKDGVDFDGLCADALSAVQNWIGTK